MALARSQRRVGGVNYWPGFVDALSTLLLAIMFLLSVFVLAQFLLSREITGQDAVLNRLNAQIDELTQLLALETADRQDVQDQLVGMQASLRTSQNERSRLQAVLASGAGQDAAAREQIGSLAGQLDQERQISERAASRVELLNQQIAALRDQIAALEGALDVSEARDEQAQTRIADLGRRLNVALAQRVQELNRFRSDFFGRLRDILSDRENVRIVGDRFVFQSEVLFSSGQTELNPAGAQEMAKLAAAIIDLEDDIPDQIAWVLRVDGHTDDVPLSGTGRFADNWELSTARATSVVKYLIGRGVAPNRLVAAGFGQFQPLEPNASAEARARNRRIELKLTER